MMTRKQRLTLLQFIGLLLLIPTAYAYGWAVQHHEMIVLVVLQHASFAVWTAFVFIYAFRYRWERTPHGVNTLLVSGGLWLLLLLIEVSLFWPDAQWRTYLRIAIYLLIFIGGLQRLSFLWKKPLTAPHRHSEE